MKEYVQFEIGMALKNGKVYNWETVKYGMTSWCLDDLDINILRFVEPKFLVIVYNDALKLESKFPFESKLKSETSLDVKTSSLEFNYLFSYEILSVNYLKLDEGSDGDEVGVKQFSMNSPCKPLGDAFDINIDAPLFMNNMDEKLEERKCELVGTPREQIAMMEQEFDE
ncbi:hypothetical protein Tco_1541630 [Tanacetum coccineum]